MNLHLHGRWHDQLRKLLPTFVAVYVPTLLALAAVGLLALVTGRNVWFFTNDPFVLGRLPFYAGIISNIGVLLWCGSASICFFSMIALGRSSTSEANNWRRFLLFSGILTCLLLFDDLFQMHQIFYPKYLHFTTAVVYGFYGFFAFWYLYYFKRQIKTTEFLLLILAFGFFALAIVSDGMPLISRGRTAISDGFKFFGIVSWISYFSRTCFRLLTDRMRVFAIDVDIYEGRPDNERKT
jgi:hypothetical protein